MDSKGNQESLNRKTAEKTDSQTLRIGQRVAKRSGKGLGKLHIRTLSEPASQSDSFDRQSEIPNFYYLRTDMARALLKIQRRRQVAESQLIRWKLAVEEVSTTL